jgi:cytidylate kinase
MPTDTIILSGLPGSGKSTLARRLNELYGYPIHSLGGLWREEYKRLHPDGGISFEQFWRQTTHEDNLKMNIVAKYIFLKGKVIGDSRYTVHLKDVPAAFVFVYADLDVRARRALDAGNYEGQDMYGIKNILHRREQDELRMGKTLFGEGYDYREPSHYHMVLNSGRMSVEEEVGAVRSLL